MIHPNMSETGSGGRSTQIKYLSKSTDTYYKSTAFSILLESK